MALQVVHDTGPSSSLTDKQRTAEHGVPTIFYGKAFCGNLWNFYLAIHELVANFRHEEFCAFEPAAGKRLR